MTVKQYKEEISKIHPNPKVCKSKGLVRVGPDGIEFNVTQYYIYIPGKGRLNSGNTVKQAWENSYNLMMDVINVKMNKDENKVI